MKLRKKFLLVSIVVLFLAYGAVYTFIALKGAAIISDRLRKLTHREVTIGSVRLVPLFRLEVKDLNIQGLFKADFISVTPSFISLLSGKLGFNELKIIKPELTYEKRQALELLNQNLPLSGSGAVQAPQTEKHISPVFKQINIKQGRLDFLDYTVGSDGIKLTVKDILLKINNLASTNSAVTNFELKGTIPWQQDKEEGKIALEGWVDLFKKNMHASLNIDDIDGIYLYPYYSQWLDLKSSNIEKAKLDFTSNIQGLNNNVTAECHLELNDLVFKHDSPDGAASQKKEKITNAVLDLFKSPQNKIVLDFTHKTRMDNPQFGFVNIKGAVENKFASMKKPERPLVGDIFTLPVKVLEGVVVSTTDLSRAAIDGTFAIGNELKKSLAASFTREKKE